jgi:Mce-associated membrane protein
MTVKRGSPLDSAGTATDGTEIPPAGEDGGQPPAGESSARWRRLAAIWHWAPSYLARWRSIAATAVVVASVGAAAGVYLMLYRPDQQVDDAAAHRAIQFASDGAVAVLSYSYDHLDSDFSRARPYLTGEFLAYYDKFTANIVGPTAKQGHLTASAKVIRAAVMELHADSAGVLVFVDQTTTSMEKKDPTTNQSAVLVSLTKVGGSWRIAKFDPAG